MARRKPSVHMSEVKEALGDLVDTPDGRSCCFLYDSTTETARAIYEALVKVYGPPNSDDAFLDTLTWDINGGFMKGGWTIFMYKADIVGGVNIHSGTFQRLEVV